MYIYLLSSPDIDECDVDNGGCSQLCLNDPPGSYSCSCRPGYSLEADGVTCTGSLDLFITFYNVLMLYKKFELFLTNNFPFKKTSKIPVL